MQASALPHLEAEGRLISPRVRASLGSCAFPLPAASAGDAQVYRPSNLTRLLSAVRTGFQSVHVLITFSREAEGDGDPGPWTANALLPTPPGRHTSIPPPVAPSRDHTGIEGGRSREMASHIQKHPRITDGLGDPGPSTSQGQHGGDPDIIANSSPPTSR